MRYFLKADGSRVDFPNPISIDAITTLLGASLLDTVVLSWHGRVPDMIMLLDDNGVAKDLPINPEATKLYHGVCIPGTTHSICGSVFICKDSDFI